jgi:hypothetical protein
MIATNKQGSRADDYILIPCPESLAERGFGCSHPSWETRRSVASRYCGRGGRAFARAT